MNNLSSGFIGIPRWIAAQPYDLHGRQR